MGKFLNTALAATLISAGAVGIAGHAEAKRGESEAYRYVTAHASTGGQSVTGAVRKGRFGDQVQTPGGNWYDCEITCEYTLRRLTVDFWEGQEDNGFVSPGYLRFDFDLDTQTVHRRPFHRNEDY
ncbi:MAG: hypothetical protein KTR19_00050 [Hyphomicrobiales bacterium]|nr:hypothetical protein [Hyphomicrobiales bacterium]